jgi:hypothetical protein
MNTQQRNSEDFGPDSHSSFLDRQARESAEPAYKKFPVMVLLILVGIGVIGGLFLLGSFLLTYPQASAAKNVSLTLLKPELKDGSAFGDVQVQNDNNASVKQMTVHYTITGASGATISDGNVSLDQLIPAGAKVVIPHVKLGAVSEAPKNLHADVTAAFCP